MAATLIKIVEKKINGDWCNIKTESGQEISINLKSNPKSAAFIAADGNEFTVNLVDKGGKLYGWDIAEQTKKSSPFQKLSPEELKAKQEREDHTQRMIVAQSCLSSACNMYGQGSKTPEQITEIAEKFYNWVNKISK